MEKIKYIDIKVTKVKGIFKGTIKGYTGFAIYAKTLENLRNVLVDKLADYLLNPLVDANKLALEGKTLHFTFKIN